MGTKPSKPAQIDNRKAPEQTPIAETSVTTSTAPAKPMEEPVKSKPVPDTKPPKTTPSDPETELERFFEAYRDTDQDSIMAGGIEKFCNDLKVEPTDFIVLAIAWKFDAKQMCMFTREQFMNGCRSLKVFNLKELRKALPSLKSEFQNKEAFKKLYYFTFEFGLEEGQRILPLDMAIPLWQCVFSGAASRPKILDLWISFLQQSEGKPITKDTWKMFYHFLESVKPDLSNYDDTDAWPILFDEFFEFEKEKNTKTA